MIRWWRPRGRGGLPLLLACALLTAMAADRAAAVVISAVCSARQVDALLEKFANARTTGVDKSKFYNLVKNDFSIFKNPGGHYTGMDSIIDYWNSRRELTDPRWLAYVMATSYHETARRMLPVRETLASTDAAVVAILARDSRTANKTYWRQDPETGQHYYGRGHVQLTWRANYAFADRRLGRDPVNARDNSIEWHADLALQPKDSVEILFDGMIYGWFTQKHCMAFYLDPEGQRRTDWKNVRRVVNVLDRWQAIADYAQKFQAAIEQSQVPIETVVAGGGEPSEAAPPTAEEQLALANENIRALSEELNSLKAAQLRLEQEVVAANGRIEAIRTEKTIETQRADKLQIENDALRLQLEQGADSQRVTEMQTQLDALSGRIGTLEAGNALLQTRVDDGLAEQRRLGDALAAAQAGNAALTTRADQSAAEARRLTDELARVSGEAAVSEARNATLTSRVDALTERERVLLIRLNDSEAARRAAEEKANRSWWRDVLPF